MKDYYVRDVEDHLSRCDSVTLSKEEWRAIRKELEDISKTPTNKQSLQLPNYKEVWSDAWEWYNERVGNGEVLGWEFQRILYEFLVRQQ